MRLRDRASARHAVAVTRAVACEACVSASPGGLREPLALLAGQQHHQRVGRPHHLLHVARAQGQPQLLVQGIERIRGRRRNCAVADSVSRSRLRCGGGIGHGRRGRRRCRRLQRSVAFGFGRVLLLLLLRLALLASAHPMLGRGGVDRVGSDLVVWSQRSVEEARVLVAVLDAVRVRQAIVFPAAAGVRVGFLRLHDGVEGRVAAVREGKRTRRLALVVDDADVGAGPQQQAHHVVAAPRERVEDGRFARAGRPSGHRIHVRTERQ
eukprot:4702727-Prymnesium_polylepis.2